MCLRKRQRLFVVSDIPSLIPVAETKDTVEGVTVEEPEPVGVLQ